MAHINALQSFLNHLPRSWYIFSKITLPIIANYCTLFIRYLSLFAERKYTIIVAKSTINIWNIFVILWPLRKKTTQHRIYWVFPFTIIRTNTIPSVLSFMSSWYEKHKSMLIFKSFYSFVFIPNTKNLLLVLMHVRTLREEALS